MIGNIGRVWPSSYRNSWPFFRTVNAFEYASMQTVRRLSFLVLIVGLTCVASMIDPWQVYVESRSEDRRHQLTVWEWPLAPDSGVKVTLRTNGDEKVLPTETGDRAPGLVEVAWSERTVAVLVCDGIADDILVGHDLKTDRPLPANQVADQLRNQLVKRYHPSTEDLKPYDSDPIKWACGNDSGRQKLSSTLVSRLLP